MQTLTFNGTQLLFVKVPMDSYKYEVINKEDLRTALLVTSRIASSCAVADYNYPLIIPNGDYEHLGTIQKSGGNVSTTIDDDVLGDLMSWVIYGLIEAFEHYIELQGLLLNEGDKYVVLKVK